MAVLRQTDWLDGADHEYMQDFVNAVIVAGIEGGCVVCRREQPDDVRWPAYAMEVRPKDGGDATEVEYRACPSCEPKLEAMLTRLGAPRKQ